jgi:hypothetical protein
MKNRPFLPILYPHCLVLVLWIGWAIFPQTGRAIGTSETLAPSEKTYDARQMPEPEILPGVNPQALSYPPQEASNVAFPTPTEPSPAQAQPNNIPNQAGTGFAITSLVAGIPANADRSGVFAILSVSSAAIAYLLAAILGFGILYWGILMVAATFGIIGYGKRRKYRRWALIGFFISVALALWPFFAQIAINLLFSGTFL